MHDAIIPAARPAGTAVGGGGDFHADQRRYPLMDGVRADWHNMSGLIGRTAAWAAGHLGQDDMAARFAADAARDRQAVEALRERYRQDPSLKYDPNAQTGFLVGEYGRPIASGIRGIGMLAKAGRLLAKRLR